MLPSTSTLPWVASVDPEVTLTWLRPSFTGSLNRSMISGGVAVSVDPSLGLEASSLACAEAGEAVTSMATSSAARARIELAVRAKGAGVRCVVVTYPSCPMNQ